MKHIVLMTIDLYPPGTDVTGLYADDTLAELVALGYIEEVPNRSARRAAREAAESADEQADILEKLPRPVAMEGPEPTTEPDEGMEDENVIAEMVTEEADAWQAPAT